MDRIFEALASTPRRKILAYLNEGELTAGEYAKEVSLARERIAAIHAPHWLEFIAAWDANAVG